MTAETPNRTFSISATLLVLLVLVLALGSVVPASRREALADAEPVLLTGVWILDTRADRHVTAVA
jgi:hypothetical protein